MAQHFDSPSDQAPEEASREEASREEGSREEGSGESGARAADRQRAEPAPHGAPDDDGLSETLGRAVLALWGELSRDIQEAIFETAMRDAPERRTELAKLLHERHPRTEQPRTE